MKTTSDLSGRALAEAAAKVMGWTIEDGYSAAIYVKKPGKILPIAWDVPDRSVSSDYECLEWARENWRTNLCDNYVGDCRWCCFDKGLPSAGEYKPGDYARALVAAAGEGE